MRRLLTILFVVAFVVAAVGPVGAKPPSCKDKITVSHLSDIDGGKHQLREAISDVCDGGTVKIVPGTITLGRGQLRIPDGKSVTIVGLPANGKTPKVTIDANQASRVFWVGPGADLTLDSVTITGGRSVAGGGITTYNGTITIIDSAITHNTEYVGRGGGGGIYNSNGTITITDSAVTDNVARRRGGGIWVNNGTVTITNSAISDNTTTYGHGGGIVTYNGTVTITNSAISDNTASGYGGGIYSNYGTVTITDSAISDNTAQTGGGVFAGGSAVLLLDGTTTVTANTASGGYGGGIYWYSSATVVVTPPAVVTGNMPDNIYPPLP